MSTEFLGCTTPEQDQRLIESIEALPCKKSRRGFASLTPERRREIASLGGRAAHAKGKAHKFTSEEARSAGRKGGQVAHRRGKAHKFTEQEAAEAGKKGAAVRAARRRAQQDALDACTDAELAGLIDEVLK